MKPLFQPLRGTSSLPVCSCISPVKADGKEPLKKGLFLGGGSLLSWALLILGGPLAPVRAEPPPSSEPPLPGVAMPLPGAVYGPIGESAMAQPSYGNAPAFEASQPASRILLSLGERRLYLYRGDMLVSSYPVAVGAVETPTPQGQFTVSNMVVNPVWQSPWTGEVHEPGANSALGLRWIEFAEGETGVFGFHGTPTVESIGQAASNGCVRMRNEDVVALFAQVSVGTPVVVQP